MNNRAQSLRFFLSAVVVSGLITGCVAGPGSIQSNPRMASHECGEPGCTDPDCEDLSAFAKVDDTACTTGYVGCAVELPSQQVVSSSVGCTTSIPSGCGENGLPQSVVVTPDPVMIRATDASLQRTNNFGTPNCNSGSCLTAGQGSCLPGGACQGNVINAGFRPVSDIPRELDKTTLPRHVIEPPDILLIEAVDNLRLESSRIQAGDSLIVQVGQTVPVDPTEGRVDQIFKVINGLYTVNVDGYVDLGPEYGKVLLEGLTLHDARARMDKHLRRTLKSPKLYLAFGNARTRQLISGQHLVRPDGTVSLGIYGSVYVTGMTLEEAQYRVQQHLSQHIHRPQVSMDVLAYNSKYYYVIADGGGAGEQVIKLPCTGNETVLDAIANIRGLPTVASKSEIWIARPAPAGTGHEQRLPVDWNGIARGGSTTTNYQLLPGDRLYVKADDLIIFDTWVAKITAPWERIFGFTILGNGTVRALQRGRGAQGGGGVGVGF